jgi:hypothetical protein
MMIFTPRFVYALFAAALLTASCTAPGQVPVNTPQGRTQNYPPVITATNERQQAAQDAWQALRTEFRLPEAQLELEPVLNTPRQLPPALNGRIYLNARGVDFNELEAKTALRRFIERAFAVLDGGAKQSPLNLRDLSLVSFSNDGNFYRAFFRQTGYAFPIANGYGELRFTLGKDSILTQWQSTLIPVVALPARPEITTDDILDKLVGRQFTYTTIAGQAQSYRVTERAEVAVKELVVYPKLEGSKLTIHLAYPIEVGRSLQWTVFVDAINGEELGVRQNFAS